MGFDLEKERTKKSLKNLTKECFAKNRFTPWPSLIVLKEKSCNFFSPHKQLHLHVFWRCAQVLLNGAWWTSLEDVEKHVQK